ncbi:UpxY family transcription antiterminator [Terriglobus roseus]|uniref:Transcription antitermination protein nusG n=1 Tax=Terriglobus roseus TaxID=392734 RepID=A0A1H4IZK9_9BACT|nr:UpxY family transcription antiterminator [Terriglobus roseus]SEB39431.1 transcription antitermination protein nusG [Terriglobus roseus]
MTLDDRGESDVLRWFAVCTLPRHEKRVAELIGLRRIESFLPVYQQEREWKKRVPVVLELPLFPTYVFARIRQSQRGSILGIPGVLSIVGNRRQSLSIPDTEIDLLRAGLEMRSVEPQPYLAIGENVRIKRGPLFGYEGLLIRKKNELRVVISVELIQQSISVEVDEADLEALSTPVK